VREREKRMREQASRNEKDVKKLVEDAEKFRLKSVDEREKLILKQGVTNPAEARALAERQIDEEDAALHLAKERKKAGKPALGDEGGEANSGRVTTLFENAQGAVGSATGKVSSAVGSGLSFFTTNTAAGKDSEEVVTKSGGNASGGGSPTMSESVMASSTGIPVNALVGIRSASEVSDAKEALRAMKKAAGIEVDVHPSNAQWVKLTTVDRSSGEEVSKVTGEVLVTIELLPVTVAEKYPAGHGRSAPNQYPTLPPPIGRVRCSANPCYLVSELCGTKCFTTCVCLACCLLVIVVLFVGAPFINTILGWLQLLPKEYSAPIGVVLALLICCPPCACYVRYACCGKCFEKHSDEAFLGSSASDEPEIIMDGVADSSSSSSEEEDEATADGGGGGAGKPLLTAGNGGTHEDAPAEHENAPLLGKK
jgi:hypothetical protein